MKIMAALLPGAKLLLGLIVARQLSVCRSEMLLVHFHVVPQLPPNKVGRWWK